MKKYHKFFNTMIIEFIREENRRNMEKFREENKQDAE